MKERIIQFLSENNLTSTKFADVIGVQRSSISHILSGRNKPSFDFIEKMLVAYPKLNAQWLITGKGNMFTNQPLLFSKDEDQAQNNITPQESNIQNLIKEEPAIVDSEQELDNIQNKELKSNKMQNDIERVIIFYSDGSFKEYKPD
ncbi:MAG: helix-turn-helix domain-containing protein [Bacteroidales bacterium]|nr:helix-turn-helix domain-containing protein [Bacteroidales bacterium]